MKFKKHIAIQFALRALFVLAAVLAFGPAGAWAALINPFAGPLYGVAYPAISGSTKASILALAGADGQELLWERDVITAAHQNSPFADNMTGGLGSGKPVILKNDTTKVRGTQIIINTLESMGSPIVQGAGIRVGSEEQLRPGDFRLSIDLGWIGLGITNTAQTQTIVGREWDQVSQKLLAIRLAKQQSDDALQNLRAGATSANTVTVNGKTRDTILSTDTFQTSLIVKAGGQLKDQGAIPMNARRSDQSIGSIAPPPIQHYLMFLSDVGARPIKTESAYVQGVAFGKDRGEDNNLFTGDYSMWDGHIVYPWVNIRHGAIGSIGSSVQSEALLGNAIVARTTNNALPGGLTTSTIGGMDGGGNSTYAASTPAANFFEFFPLYAYLPINGITLTEGTGTRYFLIIDSVTQLVSFFSYTINTGHQLQGLTRLGSVTAGDYNTTVGSVTWNTGAWLTAADGAGYAGVTDGAISVGSLIVEANAKGVPLCYGFGLGEMALVCGYGAIATEKGVKTMANRTYYQAPHGQARANGIEVAYGTAAFQRPDTQTPNFVKMQFARQLAGAPLVTA